MDVVGCLVDGDEEVARILPLVPVVGGCCVRGGGARGALLGPALLAEPLNAISIGGYQLGFWFAQQGSIYIFLVLIFFYVWRMNKLDREFDVHED